MRGGWRRTLGLAAPSLVLLLALLLRLLDPGGVLERARLATFDTYQRLAPRAYQPVPVLVVDVDDESLARLGQWPWPRTLVARLIDALAERGAAAVALDVLFSEPDRTSPGNVLKAWAPGRDAEALAALLNGLPDHDSELAAAFGRAGMVVGGFVLTMQPTGAQPTGAAAPRVHAGFAVAGDPPDRFLPAFAGAVANLPPLQAAAAGNGSFNFTAEQDPVIRRVPTVMRLGGELYPSLAVEALRVAQGARSIVLRSSGASGQTAFGAASGLNAVKVGAFEIPTDAAGHLLLHYTRPAAQRVVPAWRVLDGSADPARVEGAIVLVGSSAAGLLDLRASPLSPAMPGYEAHAQAVEQALLGHFLERPDWADGAEFVLLVLVGSAVIVLLRRLGALPAALLALGTVALALAGSWYAFTAGRLLLDPVTPAVALVAGYLTGSLLGYLNSEAERRRVRSAFGRYVSPALVRQLAADPARLRLGGERRTMSVLFCDVRGFTALSERFKDDPEGLTQLVNRLLTPLTGVILERRGTIDKYMGDCIMAFWNAPLDDPDHAAHACASALAMLGALDRLNAGLAAESTGHTPLAVGVGVNTGDCVVGNMGSQQRFDYSVLGDAVNLASRLEGQSKTYGVPIVIGEGTRALVPGWATLELDRIAVKGKREAVAIHALLGGPDRASAPEFRALRDRHAAMLGAFRAQDWDAAEAALEACAATEPSLSALFALYRTRIAGFRRSPPLPDWDGVHVATSK